MQAWQAQNLNYNFDSHLLELAAERGRTSIEEASQEIVKQEKAISGNIPHSPWKFATIPVRITSRSTVRIKMTDTAVADDPKTRTRASKSLRRNSGRKKATSWTMDPSNPTYMPRTTNTIEPWPPLLNSASTIPIAGVPSSQTKKTKITRNQESEFRSCKSDLRSAFGIMESGSVEIAY